MDIAMTLARRARRKKVEQSPDTIGSAIMVAAKRCLSWRCSIAGATNPKTSADRVGVDAGGQNT